MYLELALNYHYATKGLKILSEGVSYFHALAFLRNSELAGKKVKFIYSEKATKILRNLPLTFDCSTYSQK